MFGVRGRQSKSEAWRRRRGLWCCLHRSRAQSGGGQRRETRLNTTGSRSKCGSVDHIQEPDHVLSLGKPLTCFQQTFFRKLILPALGRARGRQETGGQKGGLWSNQGGKGWCLKDGDGDRKKRTHQEEIQEKASRGKASCSER